jgi:hypothetical protein
MTARALQRAAWQARFRGAPHSPAQTERGAWQQTSLRRIHLQIGAIEFNGMSPVSARRIAGSFEPALARLLSQGGIPPGWTSRDARADLHSSERILASDRSSGERLAQAALSAKEARR